MQIALYARVSTERQEREQTIDSQLALLRAWAQEQGHDLDPDHVFTDEGYSGSRLDRPGLDALRDAAREAAFAAVVVLSPDRLARKHAYQVLLLEELRRVGCAVHFVQRPISDDPDDQLLLQIQGAIAEYERALLSERFRRGKQQKARAGQYPGGRAPYGYRYVPKREGVPGHLVIDEREAELVRLLYRWLIDERLTLRQILKRLHAGPWSPRSGPHPWGTSVVHHILADPIYAGTAYANRYRYVPPKQPRAPRGPRSGEASCRQPRPQAEWIPIPVPAIVDQETFAQAQAQLARNAALSFRHNTAHRYLLRCLLRCGTCGLAMYGVTKTSSRQGQWRYYDCGGKDPILRARERRCPRRAVRAEELEAAVWAHLTRLLADPPRLLAQFDRFTQAALEGDAQEQTERRQLEQRIERLGREERRLLDAYQAEVISLPELAERRALLDQRRRAWVAQREQWERLRQERLRAQDVLRSLTAFCERVQTRLTEVTFEEQQSLLQLLIERIIVREDTLEIRHVIPLGSPPSGLPDPDPRDGGLRSDGVEDTPLAEHAGPEVDLVQRCLQPAAAVVDDQLQASVGPQAARVQPFEQPLPTGLVLLVGPLPVQHPALARAGVHPFGHQQHRLDPPHPRPPAARTVGVPVPRGHQQLQPHPVQQHHRRPPRQLPLPQRLRQPGRLLHPALERAGRQRLAAAPGQHRAAGLQRQAQPGQLARPLLHIAPAALGAREQGELQRHAAPAQAGQPRHP